MSSKNEQGVVLVLVMIFILVIGLLSISLLEQGILEMKMADNFKARMTTGY